MFYGIDNVLQNIPHIQYVGIFHIILSIPHNIVMDPNNVVLIFGPISKLKFKKLKN